MRHRRGNAKLGKPTDQRIALLRSLVRALFIHKEIRTTDLRAKHAVRMAESILTLANQGDVSALRNALKILPDKEVVVSVFREFRDVVVRSGGNFRITKLGFRRGDAAAISLIELIG